MMPTSPSITIAVCVKFSVDVNILRPDAQTGEPDLSRAPIRISDFDENAIEEAVQLKERHGGKVVGITVVKELPPRDVVLRALAMGLDEMKIVRRDGPANDPAETAHLLASAIQSVPDWRLVLCGEGSVDQYNGQTAPRLAEILAVPAVTYAQRLSLDGMTLQADRALEDRVETVECALPAVVSVGGEINTPRLPSVLQIMGAGRRPVTELAAPQMQSVHGAIRRLRCQAPPSARLRKVLSGNTPDEVADNLLRALASQGVLHR